MTESIRSDPAGTGPGARLARLRREHQWLDHLIRAFESYNEHYGDHYAAAITYFSVLSLIPILMLAFAVAGFILAGNPQLLAELQAEMAHCRRRAGKHDQTARFVVEPMDREDLTAAKQAW